MRAKERERWKETKSTIFIFLCHLEAGESVDVDTAEPGTVGEKRGFRDDRGGSQGYSRRQRGKERGRKGRKSVDSLSCREMM